MKIIKIKKADSGKDFNSNEYKIYQKFVAGQSKRFFDGAINVELREHFGEERRPVEFFSIRSLEFLSINGMKTLAKDALKAAEEGERLKKKAQQLYDKIPNE